MLPLKFDTSDRFACMIHHWKAKNPLFSTMCCNINLVKPFWNYAVLNTGSTAKNLRSSTGAPKLINSDLFLEKRATVPIKTQGVQRSSSGKMSTF